MIAPLPREELPLVSVVVPTYNQAAYLPSCLDSILHQDYPHVEVVVVNDASPDDTAAVMDRYLEELGSCHDPVVAYEGGQLRRELVPRYPLSGRSVRYLENETNLGATESYNRGFRACSGDYVTFVPSDDILLPDHLRTLVGVSVSYTHLTLPTN